MALDPKILLLLIPILLIQLGLLIYALVKLIRSEGTTYMNKTVWALIICFVNIIGPVLYLILESGQNDRN